MRKPEQRLWDSFRRAKPRGVWAVRVENIVDDGMPDVWIAPGVWVELKVPTSKIKAIEKGCMRNSQRNWMMAAAATRTPAYVLARSPAAGIVLVPAAEVPLYEDSNAEYAAEYWGHVDFKSVWRMLNED